MSSLIGGARSGDALRRFSQDEDEYAPTAPVEQKPSFSAPKAVLQEGPPGDDVSIEKREILIEKTYLTSLKILIEKTYLTSLKF